MSGRFLKTCLFLLYFAMVAQLCRSQLRDLCPAATTHGEGPRRRTAFLVAAALNSAFHSHS